MVKPPAAQCKPTLIDAGKNVGEALKNNQFISIQDNEHSDDLYLEGLIALIPTLKENGVKHLFVEYSVDRKGLQNAFDVFLEGAPPRERFVDFFANKNKLAFFGNDKEKERVRAETFVQLMEACRDAGIKIWASDHRTSADYEEVWAKYPELRKAAEKRARDEKVTPDLEAIADAQELPFKKDFAKLSRKRDADSAEFMTRTARNEKTGEPEKAVVFRGSGHTQLRNDLDEMLTIIQQKNGFAGTVKNIRVFPDAVSRLPNPKAEDIDYPLYFSPNCPPDSRKPGSKGGPLKQ